MKRVRLLLTAFLVLLATRASAGESRIQYSVIPAIDVEPPSDCERFYHDVCKNWRIGEWLPTLIDGFEPSRRGETSTVNFMDGFVYEGKLQRAKGWAELQGQPADGTPFVYGKAGPPKGTVVYDYADAIAFYSQGCCSWHSTVLASDASAPPVQVVNRNLRNIHTVHGIALRDTPAHVESIYGKATPQRVPRQSQMKLLSYAYSTGGGCGQFQNFVFLHDRLVYIELLNGC